VKLFVVASVVALAACEGAPATPQPCPAAGPCTDDEEPEDCGVCFPAQTAADEGAWLACATTVDDGECGTSDNASPQLCFPCGECLTRSQDRAAQGLAAEPTWSCPALPTDCVGDCGRFER
jgi:hypothetical protein